MALICFETVQVEHTAMEKHWFYPAEIRCTSCAYFMSIQWMFYCCLSGGCSDDLFLPRIILKPGVVRFKVGTNVPMYYEAIERRIGLLNYSFEWIEILGREDICTWIILELSVLPKLLDTPELSYQSNCFGALVTF